MSIYPHYYVYAYIRQSNNTPYYIGKGKGRRIYSKNHCVSVPKDKSKIIFIETNLTEIGAIALERRYIRWYGRKDNSTGILINKTDGGEGISGFNHSIETKQKISKAHKGKPKKPLSEEHRKNISKAKKGIPPNYIRTPHSIETKQKMSEAHKGRPKSEEHKQKMLIILKNYWDNKENKNPWQYRKPPSNEYRQKLSIAQKKAWEKRRKLKK